LLRKRIGERQHPYMDKNLLKSQFGTLEEPEGGLRVDISESPEAIISTIIQNLRLDKAR
jgi:gluconate kinase